MKTKRKIIEIDDARCTGCGECVPACAEGAIQIIDGKARLVAERYCDGLGACLGKCPVDALHVVEREVETFEGPAPAAPTLCPSAQVRALPQASGKLGTPEPSASALTHWPVQIRLVPPTAPFLKGADLLVAADCTAFACPDFHERFLAGKVVLVGCPKFDDGQLYVERLSEIIQTADIKSVTVLVMEVPCCRGMGRIVEAAIAQAGKKVPLEKVTLSLRGQASATASK